MFSSSLDFLFFSSLVFVSSLFCLCLFFVLSLSCLCLVLVHFVCTHYSLILILNVVHLFSVIVSVSPFNSNLCIFISLFLSLFRCLKFFNVVISKSYQGTVRLIIKILLKPHSPLPTSLGNRCCSGYLIS